MTKAQPKGGEGAEALLGCPFCGGAVKTKVRPAELHESPMTGKVWSITCFGGETNAHAWMYDDREDRVITAWNRRAPPATPVRGGGQGSSNASRAATRDHSLAAPEAEPPALVRQFFNERIDRYRQALGREAASPLGGPTGVWRNNEDGDSSNASLPRALPGAHTNAEPAAEGEP